MTETAQKRGTKKQAAARLRVVRLQAGGLFASDWLGPWIPACLAAGLATWIVGLLALKGPIPPGWPVAAMIGAVGAFLAIPLMLSRGNWLAIDRARGWVDWRRRRGRRFHLDRFAVNRLESVAVERAGAAWLPLDRWQVELRLDHPRLRRVRLAGYWRRRRAQAEAERLAGLLELPLTACRGAGRADWTPRLAGTTGRAIQAHRRTLPPPPEVIVESQPGAQGRILLPEVLGMTRGGRLAGALLWCLGSWSGLALLLRNEALRSWSASDLSALTLVATTALMGFILLHAAVVNMVGWPSLALTEGHWVYSRRWLGVEWARRRLRLSDRRPMRRPDDGDPEDGLWVRDGDRELQIARGHHPDTLDWLQRSLRSGESFDGK